MLLKDLVNLYPNMRLVWLNRRTHGSVQVFYVPLKVTMELYHLDDFVVSSAVSGPSWVLIKRQGYTLV